MSDPKPQGVPGTEYKKRTPDDRRLEGSSLLRDRGEHGVWARYVQAVKLGMTNNHAADYAGVGESTVRLWMTNADDDEAEGKASVFVEFQNDVKKARSSMLSRNLATVERARQGGDWKAASWVLERHGYHKKAEIDVDAKVDITYVIDEQDLGA